LGSECWQRLFGFYHSTDSAIPLTRPLWQAEPPVVKVFVSYNHAQTDWVRNRLVPCLEAGGAESAVDWKRFTAGRTVVGQMDATQDQADRHSCFLTTEYLASPILRARNGACAQPRPDLCTISWCQCGATVPWFRQRSSRRFVDLRDDSRTDQWDLLLQACDAALGAAAPD
jgi:hypothetical protein